jgi:hypothetical protein
MADAHTFGHDPAAEVAADVAAELAQHPLFDAYHPAHPIPLAVLLIIAWEADMEKIEPFILIGGFLLIAMLLLVISQQLDRLIARVESIRDAAWQKSH